MLRRTVFATLTSLALATASFAAHADILFQNLGNNAPPASIGGHTMTPFDLAPQNSIADLTAVSIIPGNPLSGDLSISPASFKVMVGSSWPSTWAGDYIGAAYFEDGNAETVTLTLPPNTTAFYFYATPNRVGSPFTFNVATNSGATSGPIAVSSTYAGSETIGSNGFAFYSTAGETITSITITEDTPSGYAVGEFGISKGIVITPSTTCASEGYKGAQLTWCKNICESTLTGQVLETWIHRWINRYRDLPYCAMKGDYEGPPA